MSITIYKIIILIHGINFQGKTSNTGWNYSSPISKIEKNLTRLY